MLVMTGGTSEYYRDGFLVAIQSGGCMTYFEDGLCSRVVYPDGTVSYYENGLIVRVEYPDGAVRYYDEHGHISKRIDSNGNVEYYRYGMAK